MAKTKLDLESGGFAQLSEVLDEILSKGDRITDVVKGVNEASTKGAKEAADAQRAFGQQVAQTAENFEEMGALAKLGLDELKRNQAQVKKDGAAILDLMKKRVITEKKGAEELSKIAKEYAELEKQVKELQGALLKITQMGAPKITDPKQIEMITSQVGLLKQLESRISLLSQKRLAITDPQELKKTNDELVSVVEEYRKLSTLTSQSAADAERRNGLLAVAKAELKELTLLQTGAKTVEEIAETNLAIAEVKQRIEELRGAGILDPEEIEKANRAAQIQAGLVGGLEKEIKKLTLEQKTAKTDEELASVNVRLADTKKLLTDLKKQGIEVDPKKTVVPLTSLRQEILKANAEAVEARRTFGEFSPEFESATVRAAALKEEMERVKIAVEQIQPEKKLKTIGNLATSIAGGFAAVQGIMALTGNESDETAQKLLKVQAALTTVQGLQAFFDSFSQSVKGLSAWLTTATTTSKGYAVAQGTTAAATTATTGATTAQAAATGGLTKAVRVLTTAMMSNPILAAAAVLLAIGAAVVALGDDAEDSADKAGLLVDKLDEIQRFQRASARQNQRIQDLNDEIALIDQTGEAYGKRELIVRKNLNAQTAIRAEIRGLQENEVQLQQRIAALRESTDEDELAALAAYEKALQGSIEERKSLLSELNANEKQLTLDLLRFEREERQKAEREKEQAAERAKQRAEAEAKALMKAQNDYANEVRSINERLKDDLRTAQIGDLQEEAQKAENEGQLSRARELKDQIVGIKQAMALEEIDVQQRNLERKLALIELERRLSTEAIAKMTEEQRLAAADALIDDGTVQLDTKELEVFNQFRVQANASAEKEITANAQDESRQRQILEQKGFEEKLKLIDQYQAYDEAVAEGEIKNEKEKQRKLLEIRIKAAQQRMALLDSQDGPQTVETAAEVQRLRNEITGLEADLQKLTGFNLKDALGLGEADMQILGQAFATISQMWQQFQDEQLQREMDANQRYMDSLDERLGVVRSRLQQEARFKEQGLANDYASEKAAEDELLKLKEEAAQKQAALAQRERNSQKIIQAANLASAIASLLASGAKTGIIGLGIAAAAIPFLYSLFNSGKQQAEASAYYTGTPYAELNGAPRGRDTIPAMIHEGERVVPTKENLKYWGIYEGLRRNDPGSLASGILDHPSSSEILDALSRRLGVGEVDVPMPINVRLPGKMERISREAEEARMEWMMNNPKMLGFMERIAGNTAALVQAEMKKKSITFDPITGDEIEVQNGNVTRTKRRKR